MVIIETEIAVLNANLNVEHVKLPQIIVYLVKEQIE